MSININKSIIVGHLGKKPELKKTTTGKSYCFLSVGTSEVWYKEVNGKKEKQERVDFHQIKVWGVNAENCCKWLEKGQQVGIEGQNRCDLIKGKNGAADTWFHYIQAFPNGVDFGYRSLNSQKQNPAPQANKQPTIGELMQQMAAMQKIIQGMAGAATAAPNPEDEMIPTEEYEGGPYDTSTPDDHQPGAPGELEAGL